MYKQEFSIKSSQSDCFQKMKVSSIFLSFQDLSVMAVEAAGFGKKSTLDYGYLWVIQKVYLHVNRYPRYLEEVTFETYPNDMIHFLYPRSYVMKSKDGEILLTMKAIWLLMDAKTRKIALPSKTGVCVPGEKKEDTTDFFKSIPALEVSPYGNREVKFSDLDINKHLNNVSYIEFMEDLQGSKFYAHHEISEMVIEYKKEVKEGETIAFSVSKSNPCLVVGKVDDQLVYKAYITFKSV